MNHFRLNVICGLLPFAMTSIVASDDSAAKDPRFGVMTHFAHGWDISLAPKVAESGVGSLRDELYWRELEAEKGALQIPARYQEMMAALAREKIEPLVVLSFENDFYDGGATPHTDEAIGAYARYGAFVAEKFSSQIKAVEIWNEYNGGFVRGPAEGDRAATYVRMLRTAYHELKRVRPDVIVVGGATAGVPLPYWEKLLSAGALEFMDVLSVHPYRFEEAPEGIETDVAELSALVKRHNGGKAKPIWVSEIGWNTRASKGPNDPALDDRTQAEFLVRSYALLFSAGVERVYWYLFRDYNDVRMGLLRGDESSSPKPAFTAMATMVRQLRGAAFVERDKLSPEVYSLRFRRESGESVRVMWATRPSRLTVSGVTGVTDMMGRLVGSSGELELTGSPLYVAGELRELPAGNSEEVADARKNFSGVQGERGWSYGFMNGDDATFRPIAVFGSDDWRSVWYNDYPYLTISAKEQHPSAQNSVPVSAVRRWKSDHAGPVRIAGSFRTGTQGDGVGVSIAVNGQRRFRTMMGGASSDATEEKFDFVETLEPGTTVDFVVDPGPAASIDFDATAVKATISTIESR